MRKLLLGLAIGLLSIGPLNAQDAFSLHFADATLRLDYAFSGDATHQSIYFREAHKAPVSGSKTRICPLPCSSGSSRWFRRPAQTGALCASRK